MEDSVGEEERREQEETMAQGKERGVEEEQEAGVGGGEIEENGFLSSVASKIGAVMSGTNGSGSAEEDGEGNGNGNAVTAPHGEEEEEEKKDGNGGGGIFHKLLSGSPASPPVTETEEEKREAKDLDGGGGEQAGILSTMASRIGMAMSGNGSGGSSEEEDAKASNGDTAVDDSKGEGKEKGEESNGGGIVKQLIANLPSSDDPGPLLIAIIDD